MQCSLEIIYPRSEGSRKLVPTNVNETFPLCLIHPIPLYVPRLFHHRCFLIFSRPATLELASGRGSTTSCHFIILAHSSLRLGHERGDYLGLRDVSAIWRSTRFSFSGSTNHCQLHLEGVPLVSFQNISS